MINLSFLDANSFRPSVLLQMVIYTPLIYWLTGLTPSNSGARYIVYIIVIFLCAITFAMFTRLLASFCRTKEAASGLAGTLLYHMKSPESMMIFFYLLSNHCLNEQLRFLVYISRVGLLDLYRNYHYTYPGPVKWSGLI